MGKCSNRWENYIKLHTSKCVLEEDKLLADCLKGVRGEPRSFLSDENAEELMKLHLNHHEWTAQEIQQIENDPRTIHLFATKEDRDNFNRKKLLQYNTEHTPIAVIRSGMEGGCSSKSKSHWNEDRNPAKTMFCVGCRVSLVGVNIKPEWGLYHGSLGIVKDIVYEHEKGPHHQKDPKKKTKEDTHPEYVLVDFFDYKGPNMWANDDKLSLKEKEKRKT